MDKVKKRAKIWLCISLVLMLLSGIVVNSIQTSGGRVTMKELNIETTDGYTMCCYLFVPDSATKENPAPAIAVSHGYLNNKEMTDTNYVEMARRGYVVMSVDQADHGDSEVTAEFQFLAPTGLYEAALALSKMPFVDASRIGVTGHSMGGWSTNAAVALDDANGTNIIAAALVHCNDPVVKDADGNYYNYYGSRDVGVAAAMYDEFFHTFTDENGIYRNAPHYILNPVAQSFLYFGKDPAGLEQREFEKFYTETIDGKECIHVIYQTDITHPWSHFSTRVATKILNFFDAALGAPNLIDSTNQVWPWKEAFNFVGLAGFFAFICSFGILLLFTPAFSDLRAAEVVAPSEVTDKKQKLWFWIPQIIGAVIGTVCFAPILVKAATMTSPQIESLGMGMWSTTCGLVTIIAMILFYVIYGKKNGFDLKERGVVLPLKKFGKSLLLALIVVTVGYGCVFIEDYFFYSDFRIWTLAVKQFEAPILKYLPYGFLFIAFYVGTSVSVNCFNYNNIGGKRSWVNTLIVAVMATIPCLVIPLIQYGTYFTTKNMFWGSGGYDTMSVLWLYPVGLIIPASIVADRIYYKVAKNPYIAGFINAAIVTLITITNTCTTVV